ncbi:MAG: right-handed parallel beta-helix repeat-containing protein, partial [Cruoricaptor ignavus]|nr:right-handed parallel beta-helix repeat-containing protein [Cruoricaptor ignavus]
MITKYNRLMFLLLLLASSIIINSQTILYVKKGSTGNGSSWNNAYGEVADALKFAKQNETQWTATNTLQIWVAKGTYKPKYSPNTGDNLKENPTDPRDVSFLLVNNVQLYGGFAGNETDRNARDSETNKTTLSGDIGIENDITDNAYSVVISFGKYAQEPITANTVLDGFTISGGNANKYGDRTINGISSYRNYGGGMYNVSSSPTLTNVTLSGNVALFGGGMYNSNSSSPILTNVTISENTATANGGGMYNLSSSSPTLTNATISGNKAANGGGIFNLSSSSPTLTNITISGNKATNGGGMYNYESSPILTNVTISGNTTIYQGDGMYNNGSSPMLTNVTISGNKSGNYSNNGVIYNSGSSKPKIYNSIILGNNNSTILGNHKGIYNANTTEDVPEIKNSLVQGLENTDNGNISAKDVNATDIFVNPVLATTDNPTTDGDFSLKDGAVVINKGNNALYDVATFGDK